MQVHSYNVLLQPMCGYSLEVSIHIFILLSVAYYIRKKKEKNIITNIDKSDM